MKRVSLLVVLALFASAGAAPAGVDVDFGAAAPLGDDGGLFVSISSRYFDREPRVIEDWGRRYYPDPDDLAVALYLSRHCNKGPEYAFNLRREGLGWFEISNRCQVPADIYFVSLARDPGPPYGKAYGHWKKHRQDGRHVMVLSDDDMRHLVGARMIHEYYGVSIETAMQWRASGRDIRAVMADRYRERHGKGDAKDHAKDHDKGHDKGREADRSDDHRSGKLRGDDHKGGDKKDKGK